MVTSALDNGFVRCRALSKLNVKAIVISTYIVTFIYLFLLYIFLKLKILNIIVNIYKRNSM